jgi:hypothetical protein
VQVFADEQLSLLKVGSQTYSNVTVMKISATDVYFISGQGMGNAKLKDFDPELQKHFHYDPSKVQAVKYKPVTSVGFYQLQVISEMDKNSGKTAIKTELNNAVLRVGQIVNQPVTQLDLTPEMPF